MTQKVEATPKGTANLVPQTNINAYIRVPGRAPYPLGRALQEWEGLRAVAVTEYDPETPKAQRTSYRVVFPPVDGKGTDSFIRVSEQIYEVALYTLATRRFTAWMRANGGRAGA